MHLTLRQLQYFTEIVDAGNMTRAAERLYVAPTALSLQVRAMEERLGVVLLQRHSRGVRPTDAGTELYRKARQILAMVDETERMVSSGHGAPRSPLRFGTPISLLGPVGVERLLEGTRRLGRPGIEVVQGYSCDLIDQLREGALDFVLACDGQDSASLRHLDLLDEELVFVTHPEGADDDRAVTLAEVLASDIAIVSDKGMIWRTVHAMARSAGLRCDTPRKVGSVGVLRHLVRRGLATAILPFGDARADCAAGTLVAHRIVDHPMHRRTSLAWRADDPEAAEAGDFVALVSHVVADLHDKSDSHITLLAPESRPARPSGVLAGLLAVCLAVQSWLAPADLHAWAGLIH
jgi:LysR family nitrogen assimilation transcriptional regulator